MNIPTASGRSRQYLSQSTGYKAFIPEKLPPTNPPVELTGRLQVFLSEADRSLGRLDGAITTLPNPNLFVFMYIRKEAVLSSQIEGTQSSLQDLLEVEASILTDEQPKDVDEVVNYVSAMNYGLARLHSLPVSIRLIRELHEKLLVGVRGAKLTPGELRRSQNWIGSPGSTLKNAKFVPPPPEMVPSALGDLEKFLHQPSELPLLVRIGLAHAQFETIHPFLDGNGRLGRLLITLLLCEQQVLQRPVLYLSYFFKEHRQEYYEHLQAVRDQGDWESWLEFFLRGIAEVSAQAAETARNILRLREDHRTIVTQHFGRGAANGHRVLDQLFERPIISVKDVVELTKTTYPAAKQIVDKFVEHGILNEITGNKRHQRFRYEPYVGLFES